MRTIRRTHQFKRDYKREARGRRRTTLEGELLAVVAMLIADTPPPARNHDHALSGNWRDHRDCHIRPDLVLIYRLPGAGTLELVRLGSHSSLGL
jgi:mRNA interferase YafQ